MPEAYDRLGIGYSIHRRSDPDILSAVQVALGGAQRVLNVGAGTGSYESCSPLTVGVEPSAVMIGQRPRGSAPVVQGTAETLPFPDGAFDAATALLTVHHWSDLDRGLREVVRVARRVVVLTFDPEVHDTFWLFAEYLPEATTGRSQRPLAPSVIASRLGGGHIEVVPVPPQCHDGFTLAYWRRPHAFLDPPVRACCSSFADLPDLMVGEAMAALASDLESGRWNDDHADLLRSTTYDGGLRLITADTLG